MKYQEVNNKHVLNAFITVIAVMLLQTPVMSIGTIGGLASVSITIVMALITYHGKIKIDLNSFCLLMFLLITFISSLINESEFTSLKLVIQVLLFIVMSSLVVTENENSHIRFMFCLICSIYSVFIIYSCYVHIGTRYYHGNIELFGTQFDPNYIGIPLCAATVWSLYNILENNRRWINLLFYVLNIVAIVFTASRGNYLSLIIPNGITLVCWLFNKTQRRRKKIQTGILIFVFGIVLYRVLIGSFSVQLDRMNEISNTSDNGRLDIWKLVLEEWKNKPLFGYGFNAVYRNIKFAAHNTFLEVLYDYGIIGLTLFVGFLINILKRLKLYETSFSVFVSLIIHFLFLSALDSRGVWVLLCIIMMSVNSEKDREGKSVRETY